MRFAIPDPVRKLEFFGHNVKYAQADGKNDAYDKNGKQ